MRKEGRKERLDYVYFYKQEGNGLQLRWFSGYRFGMKMQEVCLTDQLIERKSEEWIFHRMKKRLERYRMQDCVLWTEPELEALLDLGQAQFEARKQELLTHHRWLLEEIEKCNLKKEQKRSSVLFVVSGSGWNYAQLRLLIGHAKDYYEDLYIAWEGRDNVYRRLQEAFYKQQGILLREITGEETEFDLVFFLVEEWKRDFLSYPFTCAYAVMEKEQNLCRQELSRPATGCVMSGLVYAYGQEILPYQLAVNIALQNPLFYEEIGVSSVAIYGLKW